MANGFTMTAAEWEAFRKTCTVDENGNMTFNDRGRLIVNRAIRRAQRKSGRQPRHSLSTDEDIQFYKSWMIEILQDDPDISEKAISRAMELSERTVGQNPRLHETYETWQRLHCNAAPATVNNDPDSYLDSDD